MREHRASAGMIVQINLLLIARKLEILLGRNENRAIRTLQRTNILHALVRMRVASLPGR
jgi:hypothetical protein